MDRHNILRVGTQPGVDRCASLDEREQRRAEEPCKLQVDHSTAKDLRIICLIARARHIPHDIMIFVVPAELTGERRCLLGSGWAVHPHEAGTRDVEKRRHGVERGSCVAMTGKVLVCVWLVRYPFPTTGPYKDQFWS